MASENQQQLYDLLPAIYRRRDIDQGEELKALLGVMQTEFDVFRDDLETLYDNWFVETCEEWAVPYIGDLLGLEGLYPGIPGIFSQRAFVANTLAFRRRKGTTAVLEQLARDATGWPAKVVEFFEWMTVSQNANHPRPMRGGTANIRDARAMDLVHTAFDQQAHFADVRRGPNPDAPQGTYNLPNLGIYIWPLPSYQIRDAAARPLSQDAGEARLHISPFGYDLPLLNIPQIENDLTDFAQEINLPVPLRRGPLFDETEALRDPLKIAAALNPGADESADSESAGTVPRYFIPGAEVLAVTIDGVRVPPAELLIADLGDWTQPAATKTYNYYENGADQSVDRPIRLAVDPELGRIALPEGESIGGRSFTVDYAYAFPGDLGGGPYNRRASLPGNLPTILDWQVGVSQTASAVGSEVIYPDLQQAIAAWNAQPAGSVGLIAIMDSGSYGEDLTGVNGVQLADGSVLYIVAADWPVIGEIENVQAGERKIGRIVPSGVRPHVQNNLELTGSAAAESLTPGRLILNGISVEGNVVVLAGNTGELRLEHCLVTNAADGDPALAGGVIAEANPVAGQPGTYNENLGLCVERSVVSRIDLSATASSALLCRDSIVHDRPADPATPAVAINASGSRAVIESTSVIGEARVQSVEGENSIFYGPLLVERRQVGCVRYSSLHEDSQTPRRFRCQPDLAIALRDSGEESPHIGFSDQLVRERVRPRFASLSPDHPAYLRLREDAPAEIRTGADDSSEMGALFYLKQAQRESNLRSSLNEYLRFGKEVSVFFEVPGAAGSQS